jgi:hypothetical protein
VKNAGQGEAGRGSAGAQTGAGAQAGRAQRDRSARSGANPGLGYTSRLVPTNAAVRFPKDMTRTTSSLLASRRCEGVPMVQPKTHFGQVSLDVVKKIVEEQIRRETAIEQDQGSNGKTMEEELLEAQEQSMARPRTFSQEEV